MEYVLVALLVVYIAPFTVAAGRDHPRARTILALNLTLGWTGIGWLAALAWAWPERDARPRLRVVHGVPEQSDPAATAGRPVSPWLAWPAAALAAAALLETPSAWPAASWWPEPQRGTFEPAIERAGPAGARLRRAPASGRPGLGALPPGCDVWVMAHRDGWKRVWKTARCLARTPGAAEGWVPADRIHPR